MTWGLESERGGFTEVPLQAANRVMAWPSTCRWKEHSLLVLPGPPRILSHPPVFPTRIFLRSTNHFGSFSQFHTPNHRLTQDSESLDPQGHPRSQPTRRAMAGGTRYMPATAVNFDSRTRNTQGKAKVEQIVCEQVEAPHKDKYPNTEGTVRRISGNPWREGQRDIRKATDLDKERWCGPHKGQR